MCVWRERFEYVCVCVEREVCVHDTAADMWSNIDS